MKMSQAAIYGAIGSMFAEFVRRSIAASEAQRLTSTGTVKVPPKKVQPAISSPGYFSWSCPQGDFVCEHTDRDELEAKISAHKNASGH